MSTTTTAPAPPAPELVASSSSGTFRRLLVFAIANIRRRPERFVLSTLGIALAILSVTVVRTISASFALTGAETVDAVVADAQLWVVPADGVTYDPEAEALVADGAPTASLDLPDGWTALRTVAGETTVNGKTVAVHGLEGVDAGTALVPSSVAERLGVTDGDTLSLGGSDLTVSLEEDADAGDTWITTSADVATTAVGDVGWWTVTVPAADLTRNDLGAVLAESTGLPTTTDPAVSPDAAGDGLIYDTVGGSGATTFEQRYSALFSGQVTSSALGLISTIGLILGFVIAVSSFLAAVHERRREFGIMSSIGLADEVLYFFLVESGIVFVTAWVVGVLGAGAAVALVIPEIATPLAWVQASAMVAAFLPAMAIVGALVPVHRLLQQRPVQLLGGL
ncbi:FtsX-like permease family protein [Nocardioides sp. GY 10127]|uniref:ABC transporter permease n=1 Tax=Nocardioides sp. GY 10127 TaxID=2569762 RepID=UPI0010A8DC66|nr:FtsX-like permease family protein [Nocardioides sp. GY 10127]TIC82675.1 FtsX-like permease family protein [Nocardioides sp. GY 10127]